MGGWRSRAAALLCACVEEVGLGVDAGGLRGAPLDDDAGAVGLDSRRREGSMARLRRQKDWLGAMINGLGQ